MTERYVVVGLVNGESDAWVHGLKDGRHTLTENPNAACIFHKHSAAQSARDACDRFDEHRVYRVEMV